MKRQKLRVAARPRRFAADPLSPCTNVCRLSASGAWCIGCKRTRDEIARWSEMSDEEKRRVLAQLKGRRL